MNVGAIAAGATVVSSDTFTIRVDRSVLVSPLAVSWRVTYSSGGRVEQRRLVSSIAPGDLEIHLAPHAPIAVPAEVPAEVSATPALLEPASTETGDAAGALP